MSATRALHDHHGGEIDEGDVRLIVVLLAHVPGKPKLRRRDVHEQIIAGVYLGQQCPDVTLGTGRRVRAVEAGDDFGENQVRGDIAPVCLAEFLVLGLGRCVELISLHGQGQPGPGIDEDHEC
jgi:hypothetical protein